MTAADLTSAVNISADLHQDGAWLREYAEFGFEAFGEQLLPHLR